MTQTPAVIWLREDLRLDDQPALAAAGARPVLVVYVHDEESPGLRPLGGAAKWWLAQSLASLSNDLAAIGGRLDIVRGRADASVALLQRLAERRKSSGRAVTGRPKWPSTRISRPRWRCRACKAQSFNGRLMREPWEVLNNEGAPFRVFSAYWRRACALRPLPTPIAAPARLHAAPWPDAAPPRWTIEQLSLAPKKPDWSGGLAQSWRPGEGGAKARLETFLDKALQSYPDRRDAPDGETTSRLSPHLRFGEISPRRVVATIEYALAEGVRRDGGGREISRRTRMARLLVFACSTPSPILHRATGKAASTTFRLRRRRGGLCRVDARAYRLSDRRCRHARTLAHRLHAQSGADGRRLVPRQTPVLRLATRRTMVLGHAVRRGSRQQSRELAMGRRVRARTPRLISAFSILCCRDRNSTRRGDYVRRWIPELAALDDAALHAPWQAAPEVLKSAGVKLGESYPLTDRRPPVRTRQGAGGDKANGGREPTTPFYRPLTARFMREK